MPELIPVTQSFSSKRTYVILLSWSHGAYILYFNGQISKIKRRYQIMAGVTKKQNKVMWQKIMAVKDTKLNCKEIKASMRKHLGTVA